MNFHTVAIPLNRPAIINFFDEVAPRPRGAPLSVVGQRPTAQAENHWLDALEQRRQPSVADLLAIDNPHHSLEQTWTDRLVPPQFLQEPEFLTRNVDGWAPIYLGVAGVAPRREWERDPLLSHARRLASYGERIDYFGADPALVARRLEEEVGGNVSAIIRAWQTLHWWRRQHQAGTAADLRHLIRYVEHLYESARADREPMPRPLLLDELLGQLVRLEQRRRRAVAAADVATADRVATALGEWYEAWGLHFILKGEHIVGRHRRSAVLIAPELHCVVKQPGPEPFYVIELAAESYNGQVENWPVLRDDGVLVTARGRLRRVVEEGLVPRLHDIFAHSALFSTLLGLTIEPFVVGKTVQQMAWEAPGALTPAFYEEMMLHQQVCEVLGLENGDWHSANFIVEAKSGRLLHVDWGAARLLRAEEKNPAAAEARFDQVRNLAHSFHDPGLAARVHVLHQALKEDPARRHQLRARAHQLTTRSWTG